MLLICFIRICCIYAEQSLPSFPDKQTNAKQSTPNRGRECAPIPVTPTHPQYSLLLISSHSWLLIKDGVPGHTNVSEEEGLELRPLSLRPPPPPLPPLLLADSPRAGLPFAAVAPPEPVLTAPAAAHQMTTTSATTSQVARQSGRGRCRSTMSQRGLLPPSLVAPFCWW